MDKESSDVIKALAWAFGIAAVAGAINFVQRFAGDNPPRWSWVVFGIKFATAGIVGILTHWLLSGWKVDPNYINVAYFLAGWGGAETVVKFQGIAEDVLRKWAAGATNASSNDRPKD